MSMEPLVGCSTRVWAAEQHSLPWLSSLVVPGPPEPVKENQTPAVTHQCFCPMSWGSLCLLTGVDILKVVLCLNSNNSFPPFLVRGRQVCVGWVGSISEGYGTVGLFHLFRLLWIWWCSCMLLEIVCVQWMHVLGPVTCIKLLYASSGWGYITELTCCTLVITLVSWFKVTVQQSVSLNDFCLVPSTIASSYCIDSLGLIKL